MSKTVTRREFIVLSGAAAAAAMIAVSCDDSGSNQTAPPGNRVVYRLSLRGRRGSKAAKKHNANKLFATLEAAEMNRAHPGDNSRVVSVIISEDRFSELFGDGITDIADLRF
jgi:hypothetical protein